MLGDGFSQPRYAAPMAFLLVALGGGLGSVSRYALSRYVLSLVGDGFPLGTLLVNVVGSFLLGIVVEALIDRPVLGIDSRLPLGTGFMGGFTTYSSFSVETSLLLQRGEFGRAVGYFAGTGGLCLVAAFTGLVVGRALRTSA